MVKIRISKLKRELLICAMLMTLSSAVAVTLPSTSYNPYASYDDSYYSSSSLQSSSPTLVQLPSTSFVALGANVEEWCRTQSPKTSACGECCKGEYLTCIGYCDEDDEDCFDACDKSNKSCYDYCDGGSLPLGSGLCMLLMALCYGAVRLVRTRKE